MTIGERIRVCRIAAKMSQAELARACGVSKTAISKLERGESGQPHPSNLYPMAAALGVRAEWLVTGKGEKYDLDDVQRRIRDEMDKRGWDAFDLAAATGGRIAPETVEEWTRGHRKPGERELQLVAEAFGGSAIWLRTGEHLASEDVGVVYDARGEPLPANLTQDEIDLIRDFRALDETGQRYLLMMAHTFAEQARADAKKRANCG